MKLICITLLASLLLSEVISLNILGVFPYEGKSHSYVIMSYFEELARRGHNLTIVSYFPRKEPLENYHDITLVSEKDVMHGAYPFRRTYWSIFRNFFVVSSIGAHNCEVLMANEYVQNLWKSGQKFDLMIAQQFNSDCSLAIAHVLGTPVIGISTHILLPWHFERFGIANNPSYVSQLFLEGGTKPSLLQRIERFFAAGALRLIYKYLSQRQDQITVGKYFDNIPPLEELARNIKYLLIYTNFVLNGPGLYPPNIIEVGGFHVAKPKPLPNDLKKFIDESEHGVLYISFGSMLRASSLPQEKVNAIVEAISKLPQRVIWKWEADTKPNTSKNVLLSKWLPQNDILAHPKVIGFYSHCGLLGTTEALYHGVPILCMPVFGDQPANAAAVEECGLGTQIQLNELNYENLSKRFNIILNSEFRSKVKELSKIWHDRPMSPMDTAIYWTEFAARTSNFTFRSPASTVPTYQYFYLDLLAVFIGVAYLWIRFIKLILCLRRDNLVLKKIKKN